MATQYLLRETHAYLTIYITEAPAGIGTDHAISLAALTDASGGGTDRVTIQGIAWQVAGGVIRLEWEDGNGIGLSTHIMTLGGNSNGFQAGPGVDADTAAGAGATGDLNIVDLSNNGFNITIRCKKTAGFSSMPLLVTDEEPIGTGSA